MQESFKSICNKIEQDQNFGKKLTQLELRYLSSQNLGTQAKPITLEAQDTQCKLGKLYNVLQATCVSNSISSYVSNWQTSATQILVHNDGSVSFYSGTDTKLSISLPDLSLDLFLGKPNLITKGHKMSL